MTKPNKYEEPYTGKECESLPATPSNFITNGAYVAIPTHGITKETCELYKVTFSLYGASNEYSLISSHFKDGHLVGQHIKPPSKDCRIIGDVFSSDMFGQHLIDGQYRHIVITEGREDAMLCHQILNDNPSMPQVFCTSVPAGNTSVVKMIEHHYREIMKYEKITLCLDNDEPGRKGLQDFLSHFPPGKVRVAKIPLKDACEMWKAGETNKLKWAILKAETYRPPASVEIKSIIQEALIKPKLGQAWPWKTLTEITEGFRIGEMYLLAAAEGIGKTEFIKELVFNALENWPSCNVGLVSLEQLPKTTLQRMAGSKLNKRLHRHSDWWDESLIRETMEGFQDKLFLFDKREGASLKSIIDTIYYWVYAKGVRFVILDNLKAMGTNKQVEGKRLSEMEYITHIGEQLYKLNMELPVTFFIVSHLSNDKIGLKAYVTTSPKNPESYHNATEQDIDKRIHKDGLNWESGRVPRMENIYGANAIKAFADFVFVLSRNKTSKDDIRHRTTMVKNLKNRLASEYEGREFGLMYDYMTGRLNESEVLHGYQEDLDEDGL